MKKAIVFGANGFIGSYLLEMLLNSPDYEQVTVVVRKQLQTKHPKLKVLIGDFQSLPNLKGELVGDELFIALGALKKKTPDQSEYYQIEHDYPLLAAKLAKENGAQSLFIVTAIGANPKSSVFYVRTKGETERDLIALDFKHTHIFRPSMLLGNRKEDRPLERFLIKVWKVIDPLFVGGMNRYRGIDGKDVAVAMMRAAKNPAKKVNIYQWNEMK